MVIRMFRLVLILSYSSIIVLCQGESNADNNTAYCVTNLKDPGIVIIDFSKCHKDQFLSGSSFQSRFTDESMKRVNFTENRNGFDWDIIDSKQKNSLFKEPVLDQRWESFENNHDQNDFVTFTNQSTVTTYWSVRFCNQSTYHKGEQWDHLMLENKTFYICENHVLNNCTQMLGENNKAADYYKNLTVASLVWKRHNYTYLYTSKDNSSVKLYQTKSNCCRILQGCILVYLAMCKECEMILELKSEEDNQTKFFNKNGSGSWVTESITIGGNFPDCFSFSVKSKMKHTTNNAFWAVGDVGYISTNQSCEKIKRYISLPSNHTNYNLTNLVCENTLTKSINFTFELIKKKNLVKEPLLNVSSFNLLYLLTIIPLVLITIGIFVSYYCIHQQKIKRKRQRTHEQMELLTKSTTDRPITPPITSCPPIKKENFPKYIVEVFDDNSTVLKKQFASLPSGCLRSTADAQKEENVQKNRFQNIYPYDDNRVKLLRNLGDEKYTSDYINASYIEVLNNPKEYIITQNPFENTVSDFIHMIWQENIEYIVMISSANEKFYRYWPDPNTQKFFNNTEIIGGRLRSYEFYDNRLLTLHRRGQTRDIKLLHFYAWSEDDMLSPHIFAPFVERLLAIPHASAPVLFHCLAGQGRSAILLLCDMVIRAANIQGTMNFFDVTKRLRESRIDMVPNLKQYQLAHLIVFEYFNLNLRKIAELDDDFEVNYSRFLEGNIIKKNWSEYLEKTEWLLGILTPYETCTKYAKQNRYTDDNKLPVEHSRVHLKDKDPDYIHAMFVKDYRQKNNFIVAQQPLHSTIPDFWLMILQNHVDIIINLHEPNVTRQGFVDFFPTLKRKILRFKNNIVVHIVSEEEHFYCDKYVVEACVQGRTRVNITILSVKGWHKINAVPDSTDVMISIWEMTKENRNRNFPVLLCCDDGIVSSSLVACFFYMTDKMLQERQCDIVGAVRAIRRTHFNFINFEQFVFLHSCALAFYKNCFKQYSQ